ncbi:hypothetical protein CEXT_559581 [Caerostris extrusa]|uniref:Uncharacterized protein n=1 Tax=Caerostris extrusa TaxID=172846 RepID=A0AAV4S2V4_CAEEX|nr:hypothetical protein CEXT_559581 [Caerostris extrusa]
MLQCIKSILHADELTASNTSNPSYDMINEKACICHETSLAESMGRSAENEISKILTPSFDSVEHPGKQGHTGNMHLN